MKVRTTRRVHFEDYEGAEFERLVFAYHVRAGWIDLTWYGQTGSDLGRDIVGVEPFDDQPNRFTVVQCVNRYSLTLQKAKSDIQKAATAPTGIPRAFKFVCRSSISGKTRDAIAAFAKSQGIEHATIWSGVEFEEYLRLKGEYLLRRFVDGVRFPDAEVEIRKFVDDFPDLTDDDALALIAPIFDRPAFRTRFQEESCLPAFQ